MAFLIHLVYNILQNFTNIWANFFEFFNRIWGYFFVKKAKCNRFFTNFLVPFFGLKIWGFFHFFLMSLNLAVITRFSILLIIRNLINLSSMLSATRAFEFSPIFKSHQFFDTFKAKRPLALAICMDRVLDSTKSIWVWE